MTLPEIRASLREQLPSLGSVFYGTVSAGGTPVLLIPNEHEFAAIIGAFLRLGAGIA